jgi:hypothetical protein
MPPDVWLSAGLGTGIGVIYGVLALAGYRYALRFRGNRFMALALGGMLARMVVVFVMVLSVAMLVPLHAMSFTISLVVVVIISLILEVVAVLRWLRSANGS